MRFYSILFPNTPKTIVEDGGVLQTPEFFKDLNLDHVTSAITKGREEYHLLPILYKPLQDLDTIHYRHEVMKDLQHPDLFHCILAFTNDMKTIRNYLSQEEKSYYVLQKQAWHLEAAELYCSAVQTLAHELTVQPHNSRGIALLTAYLREHVVSRDFLGLLDDATNTRHVLSDVQYCLHIKGRTVTVQSYDSEPDYSKAVEATFERFQQGPVKDYQVEFSDWIELNHIDAKILDLVSKLQPEPFADLRAFQTEHLYFIDESLRRFDGEVQFYLAYLQYIEPLQKYGLHFCYPEVTKTSKEVYATATFDIALARKLALGNQTVVCNDFYLQGKERILVVSGPNQGGKTTFARTFGQVHYLASLGFPIPGMKARTFLFDSVFTHFEKEEHVSNLTGKLKDDLIRLHTILSKATTNSVIVLNEIFSSTTLEDATVLGKRVMTKVADLDALCVIVTFIDELASFGDSTVSMMSTVLPESPGIRTFKITRKDADGLAYAKSLAEKYGLTYDRLKERIHDESPSLVSRQ